VPPAAAARSNGRLRHASDVEAYATPRGRASRSCADVAARVRLDTPKRTAVRSARAGRHERERGNRDPQRETLGRRRHARRTIQAALREPERRRSVWSPACRTTPVVRRLVRGDLVRAGGPQR
jgi:hypothetical protein